MNFETRTPGWAASFFDNCTGFFYVHYTTHETNGFTSHPKDEAMVKCLADTGVTTGTRTRGLERNFAVQVLLLMLLILSPNFIIIFVSVVVTAAKRQDIVIGSTTFSLTERVQKCMEMLRLRVRNSANPGGDMQKCLRQMTTTRGKTSWIHQRS